MPEYTAPLVINDVEPLVPPDVLSIAIVVTAPVPLPIKTCPLVNVVAPVPPCATDNVPVIDVAGIDDTALSTYVLVVKSFAAVGCVPTVTLPEYTPLPDQSRV